MYTIKRKGRTICKIRASSLTVELLAYLVDTLGYTIHGTFSGLRSTLNENKNGGVK